MVLSEIEEKILLAVYNMKLNAGEKIETNSLGLKETNGDDKKREFAFYCINLQRFGFISIPKSAYIEGGREHPKYHNSMNILWPEHLEIETPGIEYVEKKLLT